MRNKLKTVTVGCAIAPFHVAAESRQLAQPAALENEGRRVKGCSAPSVGHNAAHLRHGAAVAIVVAAVTVSRGYCARDVGAYRRAEWALLGFKIIIVIS